jgi:hypothetical protein
MMWSSSMGLQEAEKINLWIKLFNQILNKLIRVKYTINQEINRPLLLVSQWKLNKGELTSHFKANSECLTIN